MSAEHDTDEPDQGPRPPPVAYAAPRSLRRWKIRDRRGKLPAERGERFKSEHDYKDMLGSSGP